MQYCNDCFAKLDDKKKHCTFCQSRDLRTFESAVSENQNSGIPTDQPTFPDSPKKFKVDRQYLVEPMAKERDSPPKDLLYFPATKKERKQVADRAARGSKKSIRAARGKPRRKTRPLKRAVSLFVVLALLAGTYIYGKEGSLSPEAIANALQLTQGDSKRSTRTQHDSTATKSPDASKKVAAAGKSANVTVSIVAKEHMVLESKQRIGFKAPSGIKPVLSAEGDCNLNLKTSILTAGRADGFCVLRARVGGVEKAKSLEVFVNAGEQFVRQDLAQRLCESGEVYLIGSGKVEPSASFIQNNIRYSFFVTSASEVFGTVRNGYKATGYKTESVPDPSQSDGWRVVKKYAYTPLVTIACLGWPTNYTGDE